MTLLRLWENDAFEFRKRLYANKTMQWQPYGGDTLESWSKNIKSQNLKTYGPTDFDYKYNSHGFRCDDFDIGEDVDILGLGCSFTEGIGIKKEDIWINRLADILSFKKIANYGIGGCGIETLSRTAYYALNVAKIKPRIIIAFFPQILRTEGFINNLNFSERIFDFLPQQPFFKGTMGYEKEWQLYVSNLNIKNRINSLIKEILFLNNLAKSVGAKFVWHTWAPIIQDVVSHSKTEQEEIEKLKKLQILTEHRNNKDLNLFKIIEHIAPLEIIDTSLSDTCLFNRQSSDQLSQVEKTGLDIARDFMHFGPDYHIAFAKSTAKILSEKFL